MVFGKELSKSLTVAEPNIDCERICCSREERLVKQKQMPHMKHNF